MKIYILSALILGALHWMKGPPSPSGRCLCAVQAGEGYCAWREESDGGSIVAWEGAKDAGIRAVCFPDDGGVWFYARDGGVWEMLNTRRVLDEASIKSGETK